MKILKYVFLALMGATVFSSCTEEGDDPGLPPLGPSIQFLNGPDLISADAEVAVGDVFQVNVTASAGDNTLQSLTIREDGSIIDLTRVTIDGAQPGGLPSPIPAADQNGFTYKISIIAHDAVDEVREYAIEVTDTEQLTSKVSVNITAIANVMEDTMRIINNADGQLLGGLDLAAGVTVPRDSAAAHIRDTGIDLNLPAASNWKRIFEGVNGSTLRIADAALDYDAVVTQAQLVDAYNAGTDAANNLSNVAVENDLYLVKSADDQYFLLKNHGRCQHRFRQQRLYTVQCEEVNRIISFKKEFTGG